MVKSKDDILELLEKSNIKIKPKNIFVARRNVNLYIVSFVLSFGSNDIIYIYDEKFGYMSFLKR